jgi:hypothetical protein
MTLTEFCHPRSTKPVCKFQTVIPQQQPPPLMPTHTHTALTRHGNRKNNNNRPESARSCMKWRNCYLSAAAPTSNSDQSQFRTNEMQVLSSGTLESRAPKHSLWPGPHFKLIGVRDIWLIFKLFPFLRKLRARSPELMINISLAFN